MVCSCFMCHCVKQPRAPQLLLTFCVFVLTGSTRAGRVHTLRTVLFLHRAIESAGYSISGNDLITLASALVLSTKQGWGPTSQWDSACLVAGCFRATSGAHHATVGGNGKPAKPANTLNKQTTKQQKQTNNETTDH